MQDEINEKTIALYIKTGKLTAQTLQKAMKAILSKGKKQLAKPPQGKQSLKQLMKRHDTPNSPNKTHFMVELSPAFMQLAATKDTDRLFSMLPYKTLSFSKIEGRHGTYALIDKGENRDREIRKPRPSIRAQLKADKAKTAPKKAAAKTKNHDMEV